MVMVIENVDTRAQMGRNCFGSKNAERCFLRFTEFLYFWLPAVAVTPIDCLSYLEISKYQNKYLNKQKKARWFLFFNMLPIKHITLLNPDGINTYCHLVYQFSKSIKKTFCRNGKPWTESEANNRSAAFLPRIWIRCVGVWTLFCAVLF